MKFGAAFLLVILFSIKAQCQYKLFSDFGQSAFCDTKTHIGKPIPYSDSLHESLTNYYYSIDLRFGINSFDRMPQDALMNYSIYGVGITHYQMNSDTIGNPIALYGYYESPIFVNKEKSKVGFNLTAGIAFHFNHFDIVYNPKNDVIGAKLNVYFNLGLWNAIKINERLDLLSSIDFTHFSNGTTKTPNKGLNLYGGNLGLRYNFQFLEKKETFKRGKENIKKYMPLKPYYEFDILAAIGGKTIINPTYDAPVYLCSTISMDFNRRYTWVRKYGIGADVFFDYSLVNDYPNETDIPYSRFTFIGIHGNQEYVVGDIALILQLGTYLWKGMKAKGDFYIRAGLRYDLNKHLFLNLSLKSANGMKADYIELGMGYRIGKKETTL